MGLVDNLKHFKVISCSCGFISVNECREVFKCRLCGASIKVVKKPSGLVMTHFGVKVLFHSHSARECSEFVRLYNKAKYKDDVGDGFYTYKIKGD